MVRMRIAVVLPAPLCPRRPSTVPGATSRSSSRKAHRSPKRLPRPVATMPPVRLPVTPPVMFVSRTNVFVHSTNNPSGTLYGMATGNPRKRPAPSNTASGLHAGEVIRQYVVDKVTEKVNQKAERHTEKIHAKIDRLSPLAREALDLWTRAEPAARGGRVSRVRRSPRRRYASPTPKESTRCRCAAWPPSSAPAR